MDSVLFTYELAKKLTANLQLNQESFKKEYSAKRIKFEKEAAAFQEKGTERGFLTEERAKLEQERLVGQQQEIERLDYELTQKLNEMQGQINQQIIDSISSFLKSYNVIRNLISSSTAPVCSKLNPKIQHHQRCRCWAE